MTCVPHCRIVISLGVLPMQAVLWVCCRYKQYSGCAEFKDCFYWGSLDQGFVSLEQGSTLHRNSLDTGIILMYSPRTRLGFICNIYVYLSRIFLHTYQQQFRAIFLFEIVSFLNLLLHRGYAGWNCMTIFIKGRAMWHSAAHLSPHGRLPSCSVHYRRQGAPLVLSLAAECTRRIRQRWWARRSGQEVAAPVSWRSTCHLDEAPHHSTNPVVAGPVGWEVGQAGHEQLHRGPFHPLVVLPGGPSREVSCKNVIC